MNRLIQILEASATALAACLPVLCSGKEAELRQIGDRIWECTFQSRALGGPGRYTLFLPETLRRSRAPLVLLFHGAGRSSRSLFEDEKTRKMLQNAPFATVMPDGKMGWWVDSPTIGSSRYEALIEEVLADVEHRFRVGGKPALRALTGWSMGGFGCVRYAERHRNDFCGVASMIGLLDWPNPSFPERWNHAVPGLLGPQPEEFNPMLHAADLRGMRILLVTGDRSFDFRMNQNFHQRLEALRIPHAYRVLEGEGHTFGCVRKGMAAVIDFYRTVFDATP